MKPLLYPYVFVFGTLVGSFLNVCVYRLARGGSVVSPPSHCPICDQTIRWYDNIPILSYLLLGGRCRACYAVISPRYVLIEALTGALFCYFFYRLWPYYSAALYVYLAVTTALIVCTFIDFEHLIIPDEITIPGIILGPILSLIFPSIHLVPAMRSGDLWLIRLVRIAL